MTNSNKKDISDYHIYHDGKLNRTGHLYEKNALCHEIEPTDEALCLKGREEWKQTCACGRFIIWQTSSPTIKIKPTKRQKKGEEWKCLFCELNITFS